MLLSVKFNQNNSNFFDEINHPNFNKISIYKLFCNNQLKNKCVFNNNKNLFIHDKLHYSKKGSEKINNLIIEKINEMLETL